MYVHTKSMGTRTLCYYLYKFFYEVCVVGILTWSASIDTYVHIFLCKVNIFLANYSTQYQKKCKFNKKFYTLKNLYIMLSILILVFFYIFMLYIIITFLSGAISAGITIFYRLQEMRTQTIIFWKHFFTQLFYFFLCILVFREFFGHIRLVFPFLELSWFWVFFIISSLSYYMVQVIFEWKTWKKLFAPKEELEAYLERIEQDKF